LDNFEYKTTEIRELFTEYKPKLQKASCKKEELPKVMEEFANKLKAIGGYRKAFTKIALRRLDKADCIIIGRSPTGRFIYMLLRDFYQLGTIRVKTDSGPLYEIEEGTPEFADYLATTEEWKTLENKLKQFEKESEIK